MAVGKAEKVRKDGDFVPGLYTYRGFYVKLIGKGVWAAYKIGPDGAQEEEVVCAAYLKCLVLDQIDGLLAKQ